MGTIQQIVDDVLDVETSVGSLKNNELTLLTAKSTQATQIRYRQRNIISALRRRGLEVSSLKIKVQPTFPATNSGKQRALSDTAGRVSAAADRGLY